MITLAAYKTDKSNKMIPYFQSFWVMVNIAVFKILDRIHSGDVDFVCCVRR